jgi:hypothetical protein
MRKIVFLFCLIFIGTVITAVAQVPDSTAAFELGKASADLLMDTIGVPTPLKLLIHSIVISAITWWGIRRADRKKAENK